MSQTWVHGNFLALCIPGHLTGQMPGIPKPRAPGARLQSDTERFTAPTDPAARGQKCWPCDDGLCKVSPVTNLHNGGNVVATEELD